MNIRITNYEQIIEGTGIQCNRSTRVAQQGELFVRLFEEP
jgi:hypothetical protein